tara:strand:- start:135 stop:293 length:159 start_codon:yes stop_codon:yes gene_type:complete
LLKVEKQGRLGKEIDYSTKLENDMVTALVSIFFLYTPVRESSESSDIGVELN